MVHIWIFRIKEIMYGATKDNLLWFIEEQGKLLENICIPIWEQIRLFLFFCFVDVGCVQKQIMVWEFDKWFRPLKVDLIS